MAATNPRLAQVNGLVAALAAKAPLASPTFTGTVGGITKSMVGLSSVDNTADADKPVSTAMQTALDLKASTSAMTAAIAAAAAGVSTRASVRAATTANITIATALNNGDTLDGVTLATGDLVLVKNQSAPEENGVYVVGASPARSENYDTYNEHPGSMAFVSEGTANADTLWFCTSNAGGTLGTTALAYSRSVISGELLASSNLSDLASASSARSNLGLGNVDNTSDANKPVSTAQQTALDLKANLASPTLTGTPAAPTASPGTSTTQLATTAFVAAAVSAGGVPLASFVKRETPNETPNDVITAFTVDNAMATATEEVFLNGILQEPGGQDYTLTDSTTITFVTAPATGDRVRISYIKA